MTRQRNSASADERTGARSIPSRMRGQLLQSGTSSKSFRPNYYSLNTRDAQSLTSLSASQFGGAA